MAIANITTDAALSKTLLEITLAFLVTTIYLQNYDSLMSGVGLLHFTPLPSRISAKCGRLDGPPATLEEVGS